MCNQVYVLATTLVVALFAILFDNFYNGDIFMNYEIVIEKQSIKDVWNKLIDFDNWGEWQSGKIGEFENNCRFPDNYDKSKGIQKGDIIMQHLIWRGKSSHQNWTILDYNDNNKNNKLIKMIKNSGTWYLGSSTTVDINVYNIKNTNNVMIDWKDTFHKYRGFGKMFFDRV